MSRRPQHGQNSSHEARANLQKLCKTHLFDRQRWHLLAQKANRQQSDPNAAANDANPFNESCWTPDPQFKGEDEGDIRGGEK
jgi:hypothetical protein